MMARTELERSVQPSLLDRLTDLHPRDAHDTAVTRAESLARYRAGVQRDVEWLLNSRRTIVPAPPGLAEVRASVHQYGLPDTTGLAVATTTGRQRLRDDIADTIARFEPRLTRVVVEFVDADPLAAPAVRFTIRALLRMDPTPERVTFDTVLDLASGAYAVREGDDADA
jgi:type VI secretion system protein ImpF